MAPGLLVSCVFIAGLAAGLAGGADPRAALAASLACAAGALALAEAGRAPRRALGLLAVLGLGAADGARARDRALAPPLLVWFAGAAGPGDRADVVTLEGRLGADAEPADEDGARLVIDAVAVTDAR